MGDNPDDSDVIILITLIYCKGDHFDQTLIYGHAESFWTQYSPLSSFFLLNPTIKVMLLMIFPVKMVLFNVQQNNGAVFHPKSTYGC